MQNLTMKKLTIFSLLVFSFAATQAQDTLRKREVNITSTFKPSLKEAAKININATPPTPDTTPPRLQYSIPNQNLVFSFQPGSLKPLALDVDTGGNWSNDNYVKIGYGNFNTPYVQGGFSMGNDKSGVNAYARHYSSKGKLENQDVSHTNVDLHGYFQTSTNLEWNARIGGQQQGYKKFGYEPKGIAVPEDSLDVKFTTWRGRISMHNINRTELGISFAPEVKVDAFKDNLDNSESNSYFHLPMRKAVGESFLADLAIEGQVSTYSPEEKNKVKNNFFSFAPALHYKAQAFSIQAGLKPSWENGNFNLFPNLMAEVSSKDKKFAIQAGWTGYFRYSGYQYLADMNPWLWAPDQTFNSIVEERFGGLKGSVGDHISYGAKIAFNTIKNQPLFINDTMTGKSFLVLNEPEMDVVNIGGELGYTVGEKFSFITTVAFNKFSTELNEKAWGLIPVEFNSKVRVQVLQDLYVNGNIYAFDGPWALDKNGRTNMKGGVDLSGGLEFRIVPNIKLWLQFNNILGKDYQRWNQYPNYGLNFLGGVVFSFAQNK